MHIHCLGVNHQSASVALRERLAFAPHRLDASLARLGCGGSPALESLREMVILSTCNRVEIYALTSEPAFPALQEFLAETQGIPAAEFTHALYRLQDKDAVWHLLRVAAGLNSQVLGEPQILGQVTEAYSAALRHGTAGKILSRLFQTAIHAGKRTRSETAISHNPGSIASVAVRLIAEIVPDLGAARVSVLGAGEMADLAVEALKKRGARHILVVNRTLERARLLADRWGGAADTLESLPDVLTQTDVLISSSGAPHTIIHRSMVEKAMRSRSGRPLVIMDIAVPRDVDEQVGDLPGVGLYDVDSLTEGLEASLTLRKAEVPLVEAIIATEYADFMGYLRTLDVVPIIVQMRKNADSIRQAEVEKLVRRLPETSPEMQSLIDALTRSIVKKILHHPTVRLREAANGPHASDYAEIARGLFGLD